MTDVTKPTIDLSAIGVQPSPPRAPAAPKTGGSKYTPKPGVFTFYKLRTSGEPGAKNRIITKFNQDLDVESSYHMNWIESNGGGYYDCQCPASRFDCRHKSIQKDIELAGKLDSDAFFCFETRTFQKMEDIK